MTISYEVPRDIMTKAEGSRVHPIVHAGKWLAADLFSTLLFAGLYWVTGSVFVATGLALVAGVAQMAWLKLRGAPIDAMQWMSLRLWCWCSAVPRLSPMIRTSSCSSRRCCTPP